MLPTHKTIQLGLSAATERFAAELVSPQAIAPTWTAFEWQMARAAAVLNGITPLLAGTLKWAGPPSWQAFMLEQREQTWLRYRRIDAVLKAIDARANAQGLAIIALKGAALHTLGVYSPGERPMADIDLLVRPADAGRAGQLLISLGYAQTWAVWKHQVFEPAPSGVQPRGAQAPTATPPLGEHEDYPVKIDLHTHIAERLPLAETDITEVVFPLRTHPGINAYASTNALLLHLLLHAAGNLCGRAIRLMHLHDIALLAARSDPRDWELLLRSYPTPQELWWAHAPLAMIDRYQPGLVPQPVLAALRTGCPGSLRRLARGADLSRMSFAALSIPAFPGLPWCASLSERRRYVSGRIRPSREQLAARKIVAVEQWAAAVPWTRMSQSRRVLHWLFRRPPRQASMYVVRAALENPLPI